MPHRIPKFITGNYYHVYNRGVAKMPIFLTPQDYRVFMRLMFHYIKSKGVGRINLLCYCLMPNHFHLIVEQKNKNGISKYLQSFLTAYSMFFNYKHSRVGPLYQGRTKARLLQNDADLFQVSRYIHRNPRKITKTDKELISYPYSSFSFYARNRKSFGSKLLSFFENSQKIYRSFVLFESENERPDLCPY